MAELARLALADGTLFRGHAFGARATRGGEIVFHTAHSGYQEILTDPSYTGQIVCMTYPQQGNYGIAPEDDESSGIRVEGFIVRQQSRIASNYRSEQSVHERLEAAGVPGISGIDTRALTLSLRAHGALNGVLTTEDLDDDELFARAAALPSMAGQDCVQHVSSAEPYRWEQGFDPKSVDGAQNLAAKWHVVALDCGIKHNILRHLVDIGCKVTVAPAAWSAEQLLDLKPDGIFLSNGPGDPAALDYLGATLRTLVERELPVFGICLGHQVLALALGATTYKLKFGHHGANHPVKNLMTGLVEITSQNHGFAVDERSLARSGLELTHVNLYDGTVEGFRDRNRPVFAVQYHPEAAPGPHDAAYLFDCFRSVLESRAPLTAEVCNEAQRARMQPLQSA